MIGYHGGHLPDWRVGGSYFEACNCEAICPCRRQGGLKLGSGSSYGVCDFALSWHVERGHDGTLDLSGFDVVLAGSYRDDEAGKPWRVCLYVDERAGRAQRDALAGIFLGRRGGTALTNFAKAIKDVYAIRPAAIMLDHRPARWYIKADDFVEVRATHAVEEQNAVSCGIPGHDHPGVEVVANVMRVEDDTLRWEVRGRCGFATDFDYVCDLPAAV